MTTGTLSVRMVWPFARAMGDYRPELALMRAAGLDETALANADMRIPHSLAFELLVASFEKTKDPALGLHAGEMIDPVDWGVMDYAARNCPDFRRALQCTARYMRLLDDYIDASLVEEGDRAIW